MTDYIENGMGLTAELDIPYEAAMERTKAAFKEQGFGVLSEIDVSATLKAKIGAEFPPYSLLGMCNPEIAHRALLTDPQVGLMLPCTVLVYEAGARTRVSALNPERALGALNLPELAPFASEAGRRIRAAMSALTAA